MRLNYFKKSQFIGGLITAVLFCGSHVVFSNESKSPNIIFVLVDDLRYDGMGFLQPDLKTPNIDMLAEQGVYFPNAVVTSSLCSPSRATILTGQTTRNHGVVDNNNSKEEGLVFFPEYLQSAGYQTGFFGKWHMGDATDMPRPGFDRWVSFPGQGAYYPTDSIPPDLLKKGVVNQLNVDGTRVAQKGYITDELTDYAMDWLQTGREKSKPFFLYLSHKAVHSDAKPAERHIGQYDDVEFELPDSAKDTRKNREGKPMWVQNQRNSWHGIDFFYASDRKMTDYLKDYYGALSSVDDSIGRLVQYLRDNDIDDNTVIVFYSDNGFLIGEHGLIDKRNAYQGSIKVPMIVWAPGNFGKGVVRKETIRNLDIAPTFLDLAGVTIPDHFEGKSFVPVLESGNDAVRWEQPDFVYEYYWEWTFPMTPTTFAIQRGPLKYIQYHGIWDIEELYDTESDPNEMNNLIRDPDYYDSVIELRSALYSSLTNRSGKHVVPFHARTAEGMNLRNKKGPKAAKFPEYWRVEPNRRDKYNGIFPDTPLKKEKVDRGDIYFPYMESNSNVRNH